MTKLKANQRRLSADPSEIRDKTTTLGEHVRELQNRLLSVVAFFIVFSIAAYPFFGTIISFLLAPLGEEHELVYLTPGGAFGFIIQACMYIGFVFVLPVIIYNLYRFIMPVVNSLTIRRAVKFTIASFFLAIAGMLFAYYISLPAALYFLTGFELHHINPMLTIDSYFSFIMTYMLVGAVLFQIPLIMLLINGFKPLGPKQLMSHQGKIVLGSFVIAAVVSPTPDVMNQTILASPMIVMYQVGVVLIWLKNRKAAKKARKQRKLDDINIPLPLFDPTPKPRLLHNEPSIDISTSSQPSHLGSQMVGSGYGQPSSRPAGSQPARRVVDGFGVSSGTQVSRPAPMSRTQPRREVSRPSGVVMASREQVRPARRSVDGFAVSIQ